MIKNTFAIALLLSAFCTCAAERLQFKISKPLCVLTFLQAANGDQNMSQTLTGYIRKHIPDEDKARFNSLIDSFSNLDLSTIYNNYAKYPQGRQKPKTIINLITIAAVQSESVKEFTNRILGLLPNEEWMQLKTIFTEAEIFYDKIIGVPYDSCIQRQLAMLARFNDKDELIFNKIRKFYGSTWSNDIPFTVSIYPIPGKRGHTTATPHSNSLVLSVLTDEKDHAMRVSIVFHEISHVLYDEQPLVLQQKMDSVFSHNTSAYSKYAYSYFDEALATACGNGWAYKTLTGKLDKTGWYNDEYINGYAHALYPLVESYIEQGKQLDEPFIEQAIGLFEKAFPDAPYNYQNLFNKMNLYVDAADHEQCGEIIYMLRKYYRIYSLSSSYPIADTQSVSMIRESAGTQLIIIHTNNEETLKLLAGIFPQVKTILPGTYGIASFYDDKKRPITIVNVADIGSIDKAMKKMSISGKMDTDKPFIPLN